MTLKETLEDIFWENTTDVDEPGCYAVEAYILENYSLIEEVPTISYTLYAIREGPFGVQFEGGPDLDEVLSLLQQYYPEEFL